MSCLCIPLCVAEAAQNNPFQILLEVFADELTLTANDPVQLQKMLRQLEWYAAREGLTVNVQKSYIVNFNAYRNSAFPIFRLYNQKLEERDYFTYLGMLIDKHMNLHHAATHALRQNFNAALRRVKEFGIEKRISDRPHAMSWLFKINICVVSWQVCQSDLVYAISEA